MLEDNLTSPGLLSIGATITPASEWECRECEVRWTGPSGVCWMCETSSYIELVESVLTKKNTNGSTLLY